jgi:hypothetical protein
MATEATTNPALQNAIESAAREIHEWFDSGDRILLLWANPDNKNRNPEITKRIASIIRKHLLNSSKEAA